MQTRGESSMVTVDAALEFMRKQADGESPYLAVVWFGSPHLPHKAVDRDKEPYKDQSEELQNFYGEITGMDRAFGKLRDELRTLANSENTILWYCSDNGGIPQGGTTGGRGHKANIYEGGLRVPGIIEWPEKLKSNSVTNLPCTTSDIYPTLLDIAGVTIEHQPVLDGVSLAPLLTGGSKTTREPIGFWNFHPGGIGTNSVKLMTELMESQSKGDMLGDMKYLRLESATIDKQYPETTFPGHAAWLDWPWKLHRIQHDGDSVKYELYNLDSDPMEEKDLLASQPERVKSMAKQLQEWQASVMRSLNGKDYK